MTLMTDNRDQLRDLIRDRLTTKNGIVCSGGEVTSTYFNVPGILSDKKSMTLGADVLFNHLNDWGLLQGLTAIGGPEMGSLPLVMGLTATGFAPDDLKWFIVRDKVKDHGLGLRFVGAQPGPGDRVVITDDILSTGGSLVETYRTVLATGAEVAAIVPLVDRSGKGNELFRQRRVPYLPVFTHADFDLPPLGA